MPAWSFVATFDNHRKFPLFGAISSSLRFPAHLTVVIFLSGVIVPWAILRGMIAVPITLKIDTPEGHIRCARVSGTRPNTYILALANVHQHCISSDIT
ncbi:hypothetical protein IQ06DRAFT_59590 [Phaeosphaeriaceae sp. SRC1lsM3a]|nr:hypothetical protein IQ06DRAFT_59590 [Stagonospora sp. SRC1lsM3a]